ncbi:conserved hypothetical protein [Dinoroseobacter shibae DFL 12 = DSM 16493]|jgi:hypothetical protein|uniref:Uncharacterized protein n=1 Tax=Dinoroseobacter shibae (strain DSM 16493 / NCIMB 14021 / DFL 12) TaxID=398580 RepID=A8LJD8_DINSH|nr:MULTISPECIES: hypothetical protein [Dinoroseobacter]ABV93160.1 conserved hypothetical protein [Dinoroseobacter shibae DFL 12 = DSM 16493]MDD9715747.1 hypothetical protein [Dinoroseobacter sp. PD6]URF48086.1 hypothetical protein M8008_07320 [Dinoroseobacter shibae]URF52396.1 hypothetical protein M8007_07320 [Dinoroseobacter shibae]
MAYLVPVGAMITVLGLIGLIYCIVEVARAKRAGLSDAELKARLQKAVALNLGALAVSALGLMVVILGVFLA